MKKNIIFIILIISFTTIAYLYGTNSRPTKIAQDSKYIFAPKVTFINNKSFYTAGTLSGTGLGYRYNTTAIWCDKDKMECQTTQINGINESYCQLGRLDEPQSFKIKKRDDNTILATNAIDSAYTSEYFGQCSNTTILIDIKNKTTKRITTPINQELENCKNNKYYEWTIEDPNWISNSKN